ncbi:MAG: divalent metal cation transporter [Candidatus Binatia bacterium]
MKRVLKILGPGLITGASDDDPAGIATYATAGAQLGYTPLWTALFTFPSMASVQFTCAKIATVTGRSASISLPARCALPSSISTGDRQHDQCRCRHRTVKPKSKKPIPIFI